MILAEIEAACAAHGLFVMGCAAAEEHPGKTTVLIGAGRGMWEAFTASAEYTDGAANPLDRWSKRVIGALGLPCVYPSDGPPYAPFIAWALASGRFWQSPTGMMVHDTAGLMISIRGAVIAEGPPPPPSVQASPCEGCAAPCAAACPVNALSDQHFYDVPACKDYLASPDGQSTCMRKGCIVRRVCPVSERFARDPSQSAFHMRAFVGS